MSRLAALNRGIALLAGLIFVLTLGAALALERKAEKAQRIVPHDAAMAALLGEVGTPVGDVQSYLIFDEGAFFASLGSEAEVRLLDETYLRANNLYPWQMKTVRFARNIVLVLSGAAAALFAAAWWWLNL